MTFGLKRGDENKNACTFRWAEMTSRPIDMNIPENDVNVIPADARWHELSDNPGEKAKDARDHRKALESNPCLAGDVSFSDFPRAEPGRTLIARITLKSGCDGSSFTKYFVQVVTETGAHVTIMSTEEMLALSQAARAFLGLPR